MNRYRATRDHHDGGEIKCVKGDPRDQAPPLHYVQGKPEDVSAIAQVAFQPEMDPAKNQGKRDECGDDASPHDQEMHQPTGEATLEDEALPDEISSKRFCSAGGVLNKSIALEIKLPTTTPVDSCRRPLEPYRITKHDCANGYYTRNGVPEERSVVVFEIT